MQCREKANRMLVDLGCADHGAFTPEGPRTLESHFWQPEYNQEILDSFRGVPGAGTPG